MQGPLKTSIRNLTQKPIIYGVTNRIYLRPESETIYNFDPFTKWENNKALGALLGDAKRGRVAITYIFDPDFSSAVPANFAHVPLKVQDALNMQAPPKVEKKPENFEERKRQIRPEGTLPPGELPPDPVMEEPKVTKDTRYEQKVAIQAAEAAGIKKEAQVIDANEKVTETLEEKNLHSEPEKAADTPKVSELLEDKPAPKRGRKSKKEVVAL